MSNVLLNVRVSPCCERLDYLSKILQQARELDLNADYIVAIEDLILGLIPILTNAQAVIDMYETNLDNILTLRDSAFDTWVENIKHKHEPVPKIVPDDPMEE